MQRFFCCVALGAVVFGAGSGQAQNTLTGASRDSQSVVVSFIGVCGYGNNLYIDNISAGTRYGTDVAVLGLTGVTKDTSYMIGSGPIMVAPKVMIANIGVDGISSAFNVTTSCTPGTYSSTRAVTSLASGVVRELTMDSLSINSGVPVNITIVTSLSSDANRTNDTLRQYTAMFSGVRRSVLFEEGTNTSCGPCAANNPSLDAFITSKHDTIVAIKYHAWWPGSTDPMYVANTTQNADRIRYYGINGVPQLQIDGCIIASLPLTLTTNMSNPYATRLSTGTPFTISVTETGVAGDTIVADVTVGVANVVRGGNYRLRVCAVERTIAYATAPGTNGEKSFCDVFRRAYPSTDGIAISTSLGSQSFQFRYKREDAWVDSLIYTAVFIQDDVTKEIMNCAKAMHWVGSAPATVEIAVEGAGMTPSRKEPEMYEASTVCQMPQSFEECHSTQSGFFAELFEAAFPPAGWRLGNPDASNTFETYQVNGPSLGGSKAAAILFYEYGSRGARDTLYSPVFSGLSPTDSLKFDWAYAKYFGIQRSTHCSGVSERWCDISVNDL